MTAVYSDPTLAALFRMVLDEPLDDGPRLVMADKLEDLGESDRAEIIRVQLELAGMGPPRICIADDGDDVTDVDPSAYFAKRGGPDYFRATSSYHIEIGDRVDVRTPKGRRVHGLIVRRAEYDERGAVPQLHEYTLAKDAGSVPWAGEPLQSRSAVLLQLHSHTWTASLRAVLPKCGWPTGNPANATSDHSKCPHCHGSGTSIGIHWSRGFPERLSGVDAGAWCGGECPGCAGEGTYRVPGGHGDMDTVLCYTCNPDEHDRICGRRHPNAGRLTGLAAAVALAMLLTGVEFAGKRPYWRELANAHYWFNENDPVADHFDSVPDAIYTNISGHSEIGETWKGFLTSALALLALSRAGVDLARKAAGLPKMKWK